MKHIGGQIYRWPITHAYAGYMLTQGFFLLASPLQITDTRILIIALSISSMIAGLLILAGLQWRNDPIFALQVEKIGHTFGAVTWAVEMGVVWHILGGPSVDSVFSLWFLLGSMIKVCRLHRKATEAGRSLEGVIKERERNNGQGAGS